MPVPGTGSSPGCKGVGTGTETTQEKQIDSQASPHSSTPSFGILGFMGGKRQGAASSPRSKKKAPRSSGQDGFDSEDHVPSESCLKAPFEITLPTWTVDGDDEDKSTTCCFGPTTGPIEVTRPPKEWVSDMSPRHHSSKQDLPRKHKKEPPTIDSEPPNSPSAENSSHIRARRNFLLPVPEGGNSELTSNQGSVMSPKSHDSVLSMASRRSSPTASSSSSPKLFKQHHPSVHQYQMPHHYCAPGQLWSQNMYMAPGQYGYGMVPGHHGNMTGQQQHGYMMAQGQRGYNVGQGQQGPRVAQGQSGDGKEMQELFSILSDMQANLKHAQNPRESAQAQQIMHAIHEIQHSQSLAQHNPNPTPPVQQWQQLPGNKLAPQDARLLLDAGSAQLSSAIEALQRLQRDPKHVHEAHSQQLKLAALKDFGEAVNLLNAAQQVGSQSHMPVSDDSPSIGISSEWNQMASSGQMESDTSNLLSEAMALIDSVEQAEKMQGSHSLRLDSKNETFVDPSVDLFETAKAEGTAVSKDQNQAIQDTLRAIRLQMKQQEGELQRLKGLATWRDHERNKLVELTKHNYQKELAEVKRLHDLKLDHYKWIASQMQRMCSHLTDAEHTQGAATFQKAMRPSGQGKEKEPELDGGASLNFVLDIPTGPPQKPVMRRMKA